MRRKKKIFDKGPDRGCEGEIIQRETRIIVRELPLPISLSLSPLWDGYSNLETYLVVTQI